MMPTLAARLPATAGWRRAALPQSLDAAMLTTMAVRLLIVAGGFVSSVITARWLSPAGRGEYFFVVTVAQTLAQFGSFGLQSSNTYLVARDRSLAPSLVANSLWVSLAVGIVGGAAAIVLAGSGPATRSLAWMAAALAPATLFFMLGSNLLVGVKRFAAFNGFQLAGNYGVLLGIGAAAAAGAGPFGFLAASVVGWTLASAALAATLRRQAPASLRFDVPVFREGFRYAAKAYAATLCGFLVVRVNVFLLTSLQGAEQVGYYSVASQIADMMGILPQSMAVVLFPALVTATSGRAGAMRRQAALAAVALAAGCLAVGLLAGPFVRIVFGPGFAAAVPTLRWMLPGVFFLGLTSVVSQYLAAIGFPMSLVATWIGGSLLAAVLGWLLIPIASGVGAAIALSLTHGLIFAAVAAQSLAAARREQGVAR
jgi:O-antigen/teichoic acid export membrane protein